MSTTIRRVVAAIAAAATLAIPLSFAVSSQDAIGSNYPWRVGAKA